MHVVCSTKQIITLPFTDIFFTCLINIPLTRLGCLSKTLSESNSFEYNTLVYDNLIFYVIGILTLNYHSHHLTLLYGVSLLCPQQPHSQFGSVVQ